ncbi:MAG: sugar ABC transporter permease [bacterium]|nr:sugar ABC transporter permease [bacterium]
MTTETSVDRSPTMPINTSTKVLEHMRRDWQLYVMLLLPLLYLLIFKYGPMYGAQIAFRNFVATKGIWGSPWVGLKHFERFFNSHMFWRVIRNTFALSFYQLIAGFPIPIILALSLNQVRHAFFKKMVQMVTYAPHFISVVVLIGIVMQFLDPRVGILNLIVKALGFEPINFMGKSQYFRHIFVWSGIWQNAGFSCIIYLAVLATIDPTLHEAAVVDGASRLQRIWHIDVPGIMPVAIVLLILNTGRILNIGFEKALLMQNPLNMSTSEIIQTYVYHVGMTSQIPQFSYATAVGLFRSVVNLTLLASVNRFARWSRGQSLW